MSNKSKVAVFKIALIIIVLTIMVGAIIQLIPLFKNISTVEGQIAFKQKIEDAGISGIL